MALMKYASVKIDKIGSLDDVINDLGGAAKDRAMVHVAALLPVARCLDDYIYLRSWAVSAMEVYGCNDNLDAFPKDELLKSYATFINTGFYKDHKNFNTKLAYGINLDAVYTPKDFVAVISAVKKSGLQPDQEWLVNQIKTGKVDEVSMGCQVEQSTCSGCGNQATNVGEYCDCLMNARMMRQACLTGQCPECQTPEAMCSHVRKALSMGITMDKTAKSSSMKGKPLYEINRGCTFFDLSAITTVAADRNARIAEVIDKQASAYTLQDFIRPSIKLACVKADDDGRCQETTCACPTGGNKMAQNLEKEAADKNPQLKNQIEGGNPQEMTDAGDYSQNNYKAEILKRDRASSPAVKKEHEIRERGQHDAGDYGPGGRGSESPKEPTPDEFQPEKVNVHDSTGVVSEKEIGNYRADAAKGVKGLGKEADKQASADSFLTELKGFFQGLMSKKAEEAKAEPAEPVKAVEMDEKGLEQVRAALREDLESLQEASDKLHDETLKMVAKASTAQLPTIAKKAEVEIGAYKALDGEVEAAKAMVTGALSEMKGLLDTAAKKGGVGKETVAALKEAAQEVRTEVDAVLDKVVAAVISKMAGPAPMISPGTEGGPLPGGVAGAPAAPGAAAYKLDMKCPVHGQMGEAKCPPECPSAKMNTMPAFAARKQADGAKEVGGKQDRQLATDAGDYDKNNDRADQDKKNVAQAKTTQSDIDKQKDHSAQGKPEDWIAYRKMNALVRKFVAAGKTLKEAKTMALEEIEKQASDANRKEAMRKIADEMGTDDLKAQLVNQVSDKLVDAIFESDPSQPKNVAAAESIKSGSDEAKEVFSPDVKPSAVASRKTAAENIDKDTGKETYPGEDAARKAGGKESPEDPADPYWDLFPEDNISSTASEANREMTSRSKETMREVVASVAGEQPLFSNNGAYEKQAATDGDSLLGSDSLTRILEAIKLADSEVEAGIIDEAAFEEEAKRLFASPPEALKATSTVMAKVARRNFKSPVPEGYMKQAVSMGEGGGSSEDFQLFENSDDTMF